MENGQPFVSTNTIFGIDCMTACRPIRLVDGKNLGMWFVGKERSHLRHGFSGILRAILLWALAVGLPVSPAALGTMRRALLAHAVR